MMRDYILTMANGDKERWSVESFNLWCAMNGERIGGNFETRLDQFRRYTKQAVVDWFLSQMKSAIKKYLNRQLGQAA